jgi:hypothetical protein
MATVEQIKLELVAEESATEPIKKVTEATRELGRETKKTSRDSKAGFSEVSDLFGSVLPRSMQRLLRGFKGTQRQVKRLSKSFKVLKAAWASIGIGVILILMEELISNWGKYSDILGLTSEAERQQAETQKQVTQALAASDAELKRYLETTKDATASELDRTAALEKLAKTLPELQGLTMDDPGAQQKITEAYEDRQKIVALEVEEKRKQDALEKQIIAAKEKQYFLTKAQAAAINTMLAGTAREAQMGLDMRASIRAENKLEFVKETARLEKEAIESQRKTDSEKNIIQDRINKKIEERVALEEEAAELEKGAVQLQREAEAAKKKADMEAAADANWLANQRVQAQIESSLRLIEDDEKRELKRLEIQQKAAEKELVDRGGDLLDVLALDAEYEAQRDAIIADYQQQRDDKKDAEDEAEAVKKATLLEALNTDEQNELLRAEERNLALQLLAKDDAAALLQIEEDYQVERDGIITKYADKEKNTTQKTQDSKLQAWQKFANSTSQLLRELQGVAEGNQKAQRRLAIADIIVNQSIAMAAAVAGAVKASSKEGGGNPIVMAAYIATALATVVGTFASIKSVFAKSGDSGGGIGEEGSGGGGYTNPRSLDPTTEGVPLMLQRTDSLGMQAFVVQSQLQGQMAAQDRLNQQIYL